MSTHVVLRIEHESLDPSEVTSVLGILPTFSVATPNPGNDRIGPHGKVWVISSAWAVRSRDVVDHFRWCVEAIGERGPQLKILRERGFQMKIYCLWFGVKGGYGGPRLTPDVLNALAKLEVEVRFDVGFLEAQRDG